MLRYSLQVDKIGAGRGYKAHGLLQNLGIVGRTYGVADITAVPVCIVHCSFIVSCACYCRFQDLTNKAK